MFLFLDISWNNTGDIHRVFKSGNSFKIKNHIKNYTWVCGDMEFLFECSTWYLMRVEHEKTNSISPSKYYSAYYINTLLTRSCCSFNSWLRLENMLPFIHHTKQRKWHVSSWSDIWNTHKIIVIFFTCGDTVFLSSGNPYGGWNGMQCFFFLTWQRSLQKWSANFLLGRFFVFVYKLCAVDGISGEACN